MQFGFYRYVADDEVCQFSADNRAQVINDPFNQPWLAARPGDTADPTATSTMIGADGESEG
jgi:hypothetical protein